MFAAKVVSTDTVPAAIYSPCWSEKACKDQFSKAAQAPASVEETAGHPDRKRGIFEQFGLARGATSEGRASRASRPAALQPVARLVGGLFGHT